MGTTKQNLEIERFNEEQVSEVFNQTTLIFDAGVVIEERRLMRLFESMCKEAKIQTTKEHLKRLIKDVSNRLPSFESSSESSQPIFSAPLVYEVPEYREDL